MTKARLVSLLLVAAVAAAAAAEKPAVLLSNAESADLYYAIDPAPLVGMDTSSAVFVGKVVSFFSQTTPEVPFTRLESLGVKRVEGLAEGTHLFVGFFAVKGAVEYPVRVVRLQAGGGIEERLYTVYREPATIMVKAAHGRLAALLPPEVTATAGEQLPAPAPSAVASPAPTEAAPARVAAPAGGAGGTEPAPTGFWSLVEPMVSFTGAFEPEIVVRQTSSGSRVIPFAEAASWGVDGVRLREVRLARRPEEVVFRIVTFGAMSERESVLLYFQEDRTGGTDNRVTLELAPEGDGKGGYAVLWRKGVPGAAIVGRFAQQGSTIVGRITYADVAARLDLGSAPSEVTIDLCTSHRDAARRTYEEYYHATIRLDAIPVVKDEGPLFL